MAIYIPIRKVSEDETSAKYVYRVSGHEGRLMLDKRTGEYAEIQPLPFPDGIEYFARVVYKLRKHWKAGEFPDATSWSA